MINFIIPNPPSNHHRNAGRLAPGDNDGVTKQAIKRSISHPLKGGSAIYNSPSTLKLDVLATTWNIVFPNEISGSAPQIALIPDQAEQEKRKRDGRITDKLMRANEGEFLSYAQQIGRQKHW